MMTRHVYVCLVLAVSLCGCASYRMLDGRSRPVYLTPDSSVFDDPDGPRPSIGYDDLYGLNVASVDLKSGETSTVVIARPTLFNAGGDFFLAFPGDHIDVSKAKYHDYFFSSRDPIRNAEFVFIKDYRNLVHGLPLIRNDATEAEIFRMERDMRTAPFYIIDPGGKIFDSLAAARNLNDAFIDAAKPKLADQHSLGLFRLFFLNKDTLEVHGHYREKLMGLLPYYNAIDKASVIGQLGLELDDIAVELLPKRIARIASEADLRFDLEVTDSLFEGLAKNYLMTRLLYQAMKRNIAIPAEYLQKYRHAVGNPDYVKLIDDLSRRKKENRSKAAKTGTNSLLAANGRTVVSLESVLERYHGKLVLVDCWASWCAPCRADLPYLSQLKDSLSSGKIAFLSLSFDKDIQAWQKAVLSLKLDHQSQYLILDQVGSAFVRHYGIETIPRYILFDPKGKLIEANAPGPGEPALRALIEKHLAR